MSVVLAGTKVLVQQFEAEVALERARLVLETFNDRTWSDNGLGWEVNGARLRSRQKNTHANEKLCSSVLTCEENDTLGPHVVLVAIVVHAVATDKVVSTAPHVKGLALFPQVVLQSHHCLVYFHRVVLRTTKKQKYNRQCSKCKSKDVMV